MLEQDQTRKEIVTTNEVVELLGISKQTIYNYVKAGKLKLVYEDWQIDGTMKFYLKDINLLKSQNIKPDGLTVLETANLLGVSKASIHQYIRNGKVTSNKINFKGRLTVFIPTEEVEKLKVSNKNNAKRKTFFTKNHEFILFGLYNIPNSNEKARIVEIHDTGEIVAKTNMGELLNKEELLTKGFEKSYEVKQTNHSTKRGSITFHFPFPQSINAPIFGIIDEFYKQIGIQNMNLYLVGNTIKIELKPNKLPYHTDQIEQDFEILQNCLIDGKLSSRPGYIVLSSNQEQLTTFVKDDIKEKIKNIAIENNTGIEDITEKLILIGLKVYEKNNGFNM
ncbi:helix-turn-helix domain-containing protein [Gottfriedia luciferensis]|uniref:helix-turn-helix domain-containing protein n=1 Tax=Gottfriedia luciferensis TaxID=178774 RepID=UPI000B42D69A|nr:helix-turn-helix domain-containing protein [Gottfriedia luciferensis]